MRALVFFTEIKVILFINLFKSISYKIDTQCILPGS